MISQLLQHRGLLRDMVGRDLTHRFAGSALGTWWTILQPMALMVLFYMVFAHLMAARLGADSGPGDYAIYLCSGMLPWFAVQEVLARSGNLFREHATVVRRIAFPPVLLVAQLVGSSLLVTGGVVSVMSAGLALSGRLDPAGLVFLVPAFVLLGMLLAGVVLGLSVLSVFMRDLVPVLPVIGSLWFWLSPIVYTPEILPRPVALLLSVNPFMPILDLFRRAAGLPVALEGTALGLSSASLMVVFISGALLFRSLAQDVADEV